MKHTFQLDSKAAVPKNCVWVESESPLTASVMIPTNHLADPKTISTLGSLSKADAQV